jgi:hypothetical protein
MRGLGRCEQLLIHDRPDWPGIPARTHNSRPGICG